MLICTFFFHLFPTVKKIIRGSSYTIIETIPTVHPTGIRIISLSGPNQFSKSRAIICRSSEFYYTLLQIRLKKMQNLKKYENVMFLLYLINVFVLKHLSIVLFFTLFRNSNVA